MSKIVPNDGDWVVIRDPWHIEVRQVIKVAKSIYYYQPTWRTKPSRARMDEILFAGAENAAKKLAEWLLSSDAQCDQDRRKADERREQRDEKYIARAMALAPQDAT